MSNKYDCQQRISSSFLMKTRVTKIEVKFECVTHCLYNCFFISVLYKTENVNTKNVAR